MNKKHMSDDIKINRPSAQPVRSEYSAEAVEAPRANKMPWIVLAVVVVVLVILGVLFRSNLFSSRSKEAAVVSKSSGFQAVFLTNGQVYFGKVSAKDSEYVTLKDIYYLQVIQQQPLQGTPQEQAQQQPQQQISLVKLGNELHGPVDEMHITKSQILFYEDLKEDGNVVKAIQQYKANPQGAAPAPEAKQPAK